MKPVLADFCVNAGPHPLWGDAGWQIAFDFGQYQVSIADCPNTDGVELMVLENYERSVKLWKHITPLLAMNVLDEILEKVTMEASL